MMTIAGDTREERRAGRRPGRALAVRLLGCVFVIASTTVGSAATVKQQPWGNDAAGNAVSLYTIDVGDAELSVTNYGARIVAVRVPDRDGHIANVVLTREHPDGYAGGLGAVMGATIGRYANRIAGGQITIDGVPYALTKNNGQNTLHGGPAGFNTKVWTARPIKDGVEMTLISPDGDMGFPGQMTVHVSFRLEKKGGDTSVVISYEATTTKPTVINLTNHTFFNLSGNPDTPVLEDTLTVGADKFTPGDSAGLPLGTLEPVAGTPLDFRTPHTLGAAIPDRGYDNNFVLRSSRIGDVAAQVDDPSTGRTLRAYTTEPGMQLFVPHAAPPPAAGTQAPAAAAPRFPPTQAFCLETQHYPDSPNHREFPATVLRPGEKFKSQTIYVFSTKK